MPAISTATKPTFLDNTRAGQMVSTSYRCGHIRIRRVVEDAFDRAFLPQLAIDHDGDGIAQGQRFGAVVGNHNSGYLHARQEPPQIPAYAQPRGCIERRERLIEQQQSGLRGQRAGQCYTL